MRSVKQDGRLSTMYQFDACDKGLTLKLLDEDWEYDRAGEREEIEDARELLRLREFSR